MQLIDSHAHLDDRAFANDRAATIARAFADKMGIITIGSDLRSSEEAVRLAGRHRGIWATVGAHPHGARHVDDNVLETFKRLAKRHEVVAIGEIGLDYYRDLSPRDVQRTVFRDQLELARQLKLPVCLHNRESTEDFLDILRESGREHRGVVHSFLGNADLAAEFLDLGLHLGIGGPVTFPKNGDLRSALREIPIERLLIETDCPYLTPVPYRGRRNEPSYVRFVAEEIARLIDMGIEELRRQTVQNTVRLFELAS